MKWASNRNQAESDANSTLELVPIPSIPNDIWKSILAHLSRSDVSRFSQTSKFWFQYFEDIYKSEVKIIYF